LAPTGLMPAWLAGAPARGIVAAALAAAFALAGCAPEHAAVDRTDELRKFPRGLAVADFDGDGKDEAMVGYSTFAHHGVSMLVEDDRGRFQLHEPDVQVEHGDLLVTVDANGDGLPDVVTAPHITSSQNREPITVLENLGNGRFRAHEQSAIEVFGYWGSLLVTGITAMTATEATGAWGGMDLVAIAPEAMVPVGGDVVRAGSPVVFEARDNELEAVSTPERDDGHSNSPTSALAFGDLNQDGRPDLIVGREDGEVSVYLGASEPGTFESSRVAYSDPSWGPIRALAVGDVGFPDAPGGIPAGLEPDGRPDILVLGQDGELLAAIPNVATAGGGFTFGAPRRIWPAWSGGWTRLAAIGVEPGPGGRWVAVGAGLDPAVYWGNRGGAGSTPLPDRVEDGDRPCYLGEARLIHTGVPETPYGVAYTCLQSYTAMIWMPGRQRVEAPERFDFGSVAANIGGAGANFAIKAPGSFRILSWSLEGPDASEFWANVPTGQCEGECMAAVSFGPKSVGEKKARLVVTTTAYPRTIEIPLRGTGTPGPEPRIQVDDELDLGAVRVGEDGTAELRVRNTGTANLNVSGTELVGADADAFAVDGADCVDRWIEPASWSHCTIRVSVTPAQPGELSATLRIESNDPDGAATVALRAEGVVSQLRFAAQATKRARVLRRGGKAAVVKLVMRNDGAAAARDVRVRLRAPRGIKVKAKGAAKRGKAWTVAVGELAPGGQRVLRVRMKAGKRAARRGKLKLRLLSSDLAEPQRKSIRLRVR